MLEDCYFFLYSECKLKERCRFRHNPLSKDNLILCKNWSKNKKCRMDCPLRHSLYHVVKQRSDTLCYWEDKGGCTKYRCEFKHMDPSKDIWKEPKVKLLTEIIESKNIYKNSSFTGVENVTDPNKADVTISDAQIIMADGNQRQTVSESQLNTPTTEFPVDSEQEKPASPFTDKNVSLGNSRAVVKGINVSNESNEISTDLISKKSEILSDKNSEDLDIKMGTEISEQLSEKTYPKLPIEPVNTEEVSNETSNPILVEENNKSNGHSVEITTQCEVKKADSNDVSSKRKLVEVETLKKIKTDLNIDIDSLDKEIAELEELLNNN